MLELGEYEKELHEKVGEEIYKNKIDILITIGNLAKYIAEKAEALGMSKKDIYTFENKEEGIKKLKEIIKPEDYILIKASNAMKFEEITKSIS